MKHQTTYTSTIIACLIIVAAIWLATRYGSQRVIERVDERVDTLKHQTVEVSARIDAFEAQLRRAENTLKAHTDESRREHGIMFGELRDLRAVHKGR